MLLLLLSVYITDYDFMPSQDKMAHLAMGYTTSSVSYAICVNFNNSDSENILTAIALSAFVGICKESYDYQKTGEASLGDLTYTIIGGTIGALISNWLFNRR